MDAKSKPATRRRGPQKFGLSRVVSAATSSIVRFEPGSQPDPWWNGAASWPNGEVAHEDLRDGGIRITLSP